MNAPAKNTDLVKVSIPSLAMSEDELIKVLSGSLYPGAKIESIKLVIGYCKAAHLDPMLKPVHIVPMSVKTGKKGADGWDETEMRDVVMPGIGMYRIQASRTGECAGITEPEFGEDITETLGDTAITYPKSCKVTVRRVVSGHIVDFTAREIWKENYASAGRKKADPNAMWKKRPYAQLAKCAEAQALRKAFPEFGAAPTADELEGKPLDDAVVIESERIAILGPKSRTAPKPEGDSPESRPRAEASRGAVLPATDQSAAEPGPGQSTTEGQREPPAAAANGDAKPLTEGQVRVLKAKLVNASLSTADFEKRFGVALEAGALAPINRCLAWILDPANV